MTQFSIQFHFLPLFRFNPHKTATLLKGYRQRPVSEGEAVTDNKRAFARSEILAEGRVDTNDQCIGVGLRQLHMSSGL